MENQDDDQKFKAVHDEIKDLQSKYSTLSNDVKSLKTSNTGIQDNMTTLCSNLEKMSKNIEDMMNKLNTISEDQQKSSMERMMYRKEGLYSMLVKKPLRKLAVCTVSTAMTVGDYAVEKIENAKEGFEDIVAEAKYSKKKRMPDQAEAQA